MPGMDLQSLETMSSPTVARYRSVEMDSARWHEFSFRAGDIVISAPPKSGTTWLQMICALLIFRVPKLPVPLDTISPWLEQTFRPIEDVLRTLEQQVHRRIIKSHTPFDGLPFDERVTYLCVGRDPRDIAVSWDYQVRNINVAAVSALREKTRGNGQAAIPAMDSRGLTSARDRFWKWVERNESPQDVITTLKGALHHYSSFWKARTNQNVFLVHFDDLLFNLGGQMELLAAKLGLSPHDNHWNELVLAASFENMRGRASEVGPNMTEPIWISPRRFFHCGKSGQWMNLIKAADVKRYENRVSSLISADLSDWLHRGKMFSGLHAGVNGENVKQASTRNESTPA